jgi:hypothetical protein
MGSVQKKTFPSTQMKAIRGCMSTQVELKLPRTFISLCLPSLTNMHRAISFILVYIAKRIEENYNLKKKRQYAFLCLGSETFYFALIYG